MSVCLWAKATSDVERRVEQKRRAMGVARPYSSKVLTGAGTGENREAIGGRAAVVVPSAPPLAEVSGDLIKVVFPLCAFFPVAAALSSALPHGLGLLLTLVLSALRAGASGDRR